MISKASRDAVMNEFTRLSNAYSCYRITNMEEDFYKRPESQQNFGSRYFGIPPHYHESQEWKDLSDYMLNNTDILQQAIMYSKKPVTTKYLVTFTRNPNTLKTVKEWKQAVEKQLSKTWFKNWDAVYEHESTNIHCHALIEPEHNITATNFTSFIKQYGKVDIVRVTHDNGIQQYMSKENKIFSKNIAPI